jgi:hypothetical protein
MSMLVPDFAALRYFFHHRFPDVYETELPMAQTLALCNAKRARYYGLVWLMEERAERLCTAQPRRSSYFRAVQHKTV